MPDGQAVNRSTPSSASPLLGLLLSQRVAIVAALAGLVVLCWLYLFDEARQMAAMDQDMVMPPKGAADLLLLLAMWWIMMVGMMLPSAAPMILTFAAINRGRRARRQPYTPTLLFTAGYLAADIDTARSWRAKGFRCLGYGTDVGLFRDGLARGLSALKADEKGGP